MSNKRLLSGSTLLLVLLFFLFYRTPTIQISLKDEVFFLSDNTFELSWIHSVEKEPWIETYQIKNGYLYLVETRFKAFGAGTPYDGEVIQIDDGFTHMKLNIKIDSLDVIVSENVQTTLHTKNGNIPLYELVGNHDSVSITVKKIPFWRSLRGDFK